MAAGRKKIVMKFGGTSIKDSTSIGNVIHIVKKGKAPKIVVVSAIAEVLILLKQYHGLHQIIK